MLFYLANHIQNASVGTTWESVFSPLRVFDYISVRSGGAALTALVSDSSIKGQTT